MDLAWIDFVVQILAEGNEKNLWYNDTREGHYYHEYGNINNKPVGHILLVCGGMIGCYEPWLFLWTDAASCAAARYSSA